MKPARQLSGRKVTVILYTAVLATISTVLIGTYSMGRPSDAPLPVDVTIEKRPVPVPDGTGAVVTDVIVVKNNSDDEFPKLDISINGQYFLYRDSPLMPREELVVPQSIFSTKSNLRYDCKKYPIDSIVVTGRLPSGSRGVHEIEFNN